MKSIITASAILLVISMISSFGDAFTPAIHDQRKGLIGASTTRKIVSPTGHITSSTTTSTVSRVGKNPTTTSLSAAAAAGSPKKKKKKTTKKKATKKKATKKKAKSTEEVVTFRKPEFVSRIAEKTGMSKADSEAALSAVLETITEEVASGKRISMLGFGTFKLTHRKARKGRNPKTGEPIDIAASNSPSFSAGKAFKERCNP